VAHERSTDRTPSRQRPWITSSASQPGRSGLGARLPEGGQIGIDPCGHLETGRGEMRRAGAGVDAGPLLDEALVAQGSDCVRDRGRRHPELLSKGAAARRPRGVDVPQDLGLERREPGARGDVLHERPPSVRDAFEGRRQPSSHIGGPIRGHFRGRIAAACCHAAKHTH